MISKRKTAIKKARPKKAKPKKEFRLYVLYSESSSGGDIVEGQEEESFPEREDEYLYVQFHGLCRSEPDTFFKHSVEVSEDIFNSSTLVLAVVRYTDGGTFGCTHGYWHIVGAYKSVIEAQAALKQAHESDNYKPWVGYFSSHDSDEVIPLVVTD